MHTSLLSADHSTHARVVLTAFMAAAAFVWMALAANPAPGAAAAATNAATQVAASIAAR